MVFITIDQARQASRAVWANRSVAESEIRKSASVSIDTSFDIFMSHSFKDAEVIAGIKILIENTGLRVYVDWMEDAQLDRSQVTAETAQILRQRMSHCGFLLYATSEASPDSKWMPWELGYFDGLKGGRVGIFPIAKSEDRTNFAGQEYLKLYPYYEIIDFADLGNQVGRYTASDKSKGMVLKKEIQRLLTSGHPSVILLTCQVATTPVCSRRL